MAESGGVAPQPAFEPVRSISRRRPRACRVHSPRWRRTEITLPSRSFTGPARFRRAPALGWFILQSGGELGSRPPTGMGPSICFQGSGSAPVCSAHPRWRPWQELHPHYSAFEARPTVYCRHGRKMARDPGVAPGLFRVRTAADCLLPSRAKDSAAGIAPAFMRLEGAGLICSTHAERWCPRPKLRRDLLLRRERSCLVGRRWH